MQKRAINAAITAITGTALAGGLAVGVAMAGAGPANAGKDAHNAAAVSKAQAQSKPQSTIKAQPKPKPKPKPQPKPLLTGTTTSSYFWDDGSGINGDTGAPAGGKPMQKGLFASPSWPLGTKVKVTYKGRSVTGFVGDRGPGEPSHRGVMLDLDTYTFRHLLDGGQPASKYDAGTDEGHLQGVRYEVISWGSGPGVKGEPQPLG